MQLPLYKRPHVDTQCNAHVYLCDSVLAKKILSPFLNIYSGVHQYHFHSCVFASCIICIDIEDCPYVSLCDPTRLSHNIREAYYTLAVKISTTMTMFSIKQIFIYQLIIVRNSTKCYN